MDDYQVKVEALQVLKHELEVLKETGNCSSEINVKEYQIILAKEALESMNASEDQKNHLTERDKIYKFDEFINSILDGIKLEMAGKPDITLQQFIYKYESCYRDCIDDFIANPEDDEEE